MSETTAARATLSVPESLATCHAAPRGRVAR